MSRPEFTGHALDQWAYRNRVQVKLIAPGKPTQNAYVESFNGKFRDECLNDHWLESLHAARALISSPIGGATTTRTAHIARLVIARRPNLPRYIELRDAHQGRGNQLVFQLDFANTPTALLLGAGQ